jgi:SAM-dependent methyltransferase
METAVLTTEMDALKAKIKSTWMAGDFGQIAKSYAPSAAEFVTRLGFGPGERVLDMACGTGNLAVPAAKTGATVVGQDIAPNLLEQARAWAKKERLTIRFDENDAEDLPYADGTFDAVISMFGAMFTPQPAVVASEMVRTCRPGGRIAMANWTPGGFIGQMFKIVGKYAPPAPGMPSPLLWGNEETVPERFNGSLADLQFTRREINFYFPFPPAAVVECFRTYYGPTYKAFGSLDAAGQAALAEELTAHWSAHNQVANGETRLTSEYLDVLATKAA